MTRELTETGGEVAPPTGSWEKQPFVGRMPHRRRQQWRSRNFGYEVAQ